MKRLKLRSKTNQQANKVDEKKRSGRRNLLKTLWFWLLSWAAVATVLPTMCWKSGKETIDRIPEIDMAKKIQEALDNADVEIQWLEYESALPFQFDFDLRDHDDYKEEGGSKERNIIKKIGDAIGDRTDMHTAKWLQWSKNIFLTYWLKGSGYQQATKNVKETKDSYNITIKDIPLEIMTNKRLEWINNHQQSKWYSWLQ